jgi:hypothetical protein
METIKKIDTIELEENKQIIIAKKILLDEECDELIELYKASDKSDIDVLGCRLYAKTIIPQHIIDKIYSLLSNYVLIKKIESQSAIYYTVGGEIKEHTDRILYDEETKSYSKYTLVIYLSNTEELGGITRIKRTKINTFEEKNESMKHERHWIRPIKGHCVLFNSNLSHNATESYGDKYILVTKVY